MLCRCYASKMRKGSCPVYCLVIKLLLLMLLMILQRTSGRAELIKIAREMIEMRDKELDKH